jgi:sigma-B regulation protein RsbU (phosphoserine phosphatase)
VLQAGQFQTPEELIKATFADVQAFADGAEQSDDITLLALSFLRSPATGDAVSFSVTMKNQLSEMVGVLAALDQFVAEHQIPAESGKKVKLAFDEFLNNIVSYGFPDGGEHEIDVSVEKFDQRLTITIIDDGVPFNPFQKETPDLDASLEDRQIGGVGIHLVRELMDEVSYRRGVDRNIVTLIKNLSSSA